MSASLWKSPKKTNIKHNNRKQEKYDNKEIDISRMIYNKYLVQENIRDLYHREFNEPLEKYNNKQKRKDRKIKNYYEHVSSGKKTNPQQEMIVQVGSGFRGEDYEFGDDNWNKINEILEEYFNEFEKRNPNLKVYNAVIHNDETSPHLHINFVPVASGYKRGLEKQVAFDRAIKQQDKSLDVTHPFEAWRDSEISVLEKLMNERGIERKEVGTNEYEDTNDLKEKTEKLRKLEIKVENELEKLEVLTEPSESDTDKLKPIIVDENYRPMPEVELKRTMMGNYTVDPEEVNDLKDYAMHLRQYNTDLKDELDKSKEDYQKLRKAFKKDDKMIDRLVSDKVYSERQKTARERFNYDKQVGTMWEDLESLKSENKILQKWRNKAIEFMEKINVYDKFKKIMMSSKKNKNINQDLER